MLADFGHFGTYVTLSRKHSQPLSYISNLPADEVYMMLLYDKEVSEYEKRLADIQRKVSKVET